MKKILLLSAVLLFGAVSVSRAGVHFGFSFPLPPIPIPGVVVSPPVYSAPAPAYCPPAGYYNGYCGPTVTVSPYYGYYGYRPYYYGRPYYGYHHGYYGHGHYAGHGYHHR